MFVSRSLQNISLEVRVAHEVMCIEIPSLVLASLNVFSWKSVERDGSACLWITEIV
jgi:hypothetical protein